MNKSFFLLFLLAHFLYYCFGIENMITKPNFQLGYQNLIESDSVKYLFTDSSFIKVYYIDGNEHEAIEFNQDSTIKKITNYILLHGILLVSQEINFHPNGAVTSIKVLKELQNRFDSTLQVHYETGIYEFIVK